MRIKYSPGKDLLIIEVSKNRPENVADVVVVDKFPGHTWKLNGATREIFYLKMDNASEELGEIWLSEMLAAQLLSEYLEDRPETTKLFLPPLSSETVIGDCLKNEN